MPWENPAMYGAGPFQFDLPDEQQQTPQQRVGALVRRGRAGVQVQPQQQQEQPVVPNFQGEGQGVPPGFLQNFRPVPGQEQQGPVQIPQAVQPNAGPVPAIPKTINFGPAPAGFLDAGPAGAGRAPQFQEGVGGSTLSLDGRRAGVQVPANQPRVGVQGVNGLPAGPMPPPGLGDVNAVMAAVLRGAGVDEAFAQGMNTRPAASPPQNVQSALEKALTGALESRQGPPAQPIPGYAVSADGKSIRGPDGSTTFGRSYVEQQLQKQMDEQAMQAGRMPSFSRFITRDYGPMDPLSLHLARQDPAKMSAYNAAEGRQLAGDELASKDRATTLSAAGGLEQERMRGQTQIAVEQIKQGTEKSKVIQAIAAGPGTASEKEAQIEAVNAALDYSTEQKALHEQGYPPALLPSGQKVGALMPKGRAGVQVPAGGSDKTPEDRLNAATEKLGKAATSEQISQVLKAGFPDAKFDDKGNITSAGGFNVEPLLDALAGSGNVKNNGLKDLLGKLGNVPAVGGAHSLKTELEKQLIAAHRDLRYPRMAGRGKQASPVQFGGMQVQPSVSPPSWMFGEPSVSGYGVTIPGSDRGTWHPSGLIDPGGFIGPVTAAQKAAARNRAEAAGMLLRALHGD